MDASKVKVSIDCWWHLQVCRILLAARAQQVRVGRAVWTVTLTRAKLGCVRG